MGGSVQKLSNYIKSIIKTVEEKPESSEKRILEDENSSYTSVSSLSSSTQSAENTEEQS